MAGQKKVNSNVEVKKEVVETKPAPVETKSVATPAKKGGKAAPVVAEPVVTPAAAPAAFVAAMRPAVAVLALHQYAHHQLASDVVNPHARRPHQNK